MLSFFTLALLIGMSHALEADHVAAVSAMASRDRRVSSIVRTGAVWGLGHALTLTIFAGAALVLGLSFGSELVGWLEFCVGLMLMGLGGHILYRLVRDRVHFHAHRHALGATHFHAHSHVGEAARTHDAMSHDTMNHDHDHPPFPFKSLFVGMMHGMAGSAALLILTASTAPTPGMGLIYLAMFGLGSILGMAALSAVIAVPLALSARLLTRANRALHLGIGLATFALGFHMAFVVHLADLVAL